MTEISEQLEAVIRDIETRTPHGANCISERRVVHDCTCDYDARRLAGIARTVERIGNAMCAAYEPYAPDFDDVAWAAALRSASPEVPLTFGMPHEPGDDMGGQST